MNWQGLRERTVGLTGRLIQTSDALLTKVGDMVAPVQTEVGQLHLAMRERDWPRTHQLLTSGAINAHALGDHTGGSALHLAAQHGFGDAAEFLIQSMGIDSNARDRNGEAPLHFAARAGATPVAHLLIQRGADASARSTRGETAYDVAHDLSLRQWLLPIQLQARFGGRQSGRHAREEENISSVSSAGEAVVAPALLLPRRPPSYFEESSGGV